MRLAIVRRKTAMPWTASTVIIRWVHNPKGPWFGEKRPSKFDEKGLALKEE